MTILLIVVIAGVAAAAGYFFGKGVGRLEGFAQLAREIAKESTFVVDGMTGGRSDDYKNRLDTLRLEYDTSRTLREWRNIPARTLYGVGFDEGKKVGHREATGGA